MSLKTGTDSPTDSLIHLLTHSLTHSFIHSGVSLLLSIVGIVIAMFGANFDDGEYSINDLAGLFKREVVIICTALFITIIITGRFYSNHEPSFSSSTMGIIYIAFVSSLLSGM